MRLYPESLSQKIGFDAIKTRLAAYALSEHTQEWIHAMNPVASAKNVRQMLAQTAEYLNLVNAEEDLPFVGLPDIREYLKVLKIQDYVLPLVSFNQILAIAESARKCQQFIAKKEEGFQELKGICTALSNLSDLEKNIKGVITKENDVRTDASPELVKIRRTLNQKRAELRSVTQRVLRRTKELDMSSDEGITLRDGRMVIPIKAEYKRKIDGFVHDISSTGQTVYVEPVEALNVNNEIRQLELEERKEIERILRKLSAHVAAKKDLLRLNEETLCALDLIRAKAMLTRLLNGAVCLPSDDQSIRLYDAFNPHLVLRNLSKLATEKEEIIPLDLELNQEERTLIITGPNAGGKSVAMKSLGLLVCMQQCGIGLSAREDSRIPVFENIYVDLGDDQSVENDLSTFSSRLFWMDKCAQGVTKRSLVLIDEAGTGTDPEEGSALYQAFIEFLIDAGARSIVTTHHGSLKVFAEEHPNAVNGSMEFNQEKLEPTYKFRKGVPGSSYGFEIARRMHLSQAIIERARVLSGGVKNKVENLIISLEKNEQEAIRQKLQYEKLRKEANTAKNDYDTKLKSARKKADKIREQALVEAKNIVEKANQRIEKAVEEALRVAKSKEEAQKARRGINKLKNKIGSELHQIEENKRKELLKDNDAPKVGDGVKLLDSNTSGELVEHKGNSAVVLANGLKLRTKYKNLVKVLDASSLKKVQEKSASSRRSYKLSVADEVVSPKEGVKEEIVSMRLDLRGFRGQEAVRELQLYIDKVSQSGLNQVQIVHGKGNGILRKLVHDYLATEPQVSHFEIAPVDQGGDGCTLVTL